MAAGQGRAGEKAGRQPRCPLTVVITLYTLSARAKPRLPSTAMENLEEERYTIAGKNLQPRGAFHGVLPCLAESPIGGAPTNAF